LSFWPRKIEDAGVRRAREKPDELLVVGPADPVEDAPILRSEVRRALEEHNLADLSPFHLDRVFVGPAAISFKRRLPDSVLMLDLGIEALADLLRWDCPLRRIVNAPNASPRAGYVGRLFIRLRTCSLGKGNANAKD